MLGLRALPFPSTCLLLGACLLPLPSRLAAQPAGWTALGGPEAGTVNEVAAGADGRVWAVTKTAGLFRSDDGAARWNRVERGPVSGHQGSGLDPSWVRGEIQAFAAHPEDPDIAYAATRQTVLRTADGGETWEPTGLSRNIEVIAISPSDPEVAYLSNRRQVWRTDNGGDTWRQADRGLGDPGYIYSLTVDPHSPFTVYIAAGSGSYRSIDGGRSWVRGDGLSFVELVRITVDPDDPAVLYGAERFDNVWKSVDQGLSWTRLATFPGSPGLADLEFDPSSHGTLYLALNGGTPSAGRPAGRVLRSLDRGVTWTEVLATELIHDLDFDLDQPGRAYVATDVLGVFRSEDSGTTWAPANEGLTAAQVLRLTLAPHSPGTLYAVVSSFRKEIFEPGSLGVWKSTDGGVSWSPINAGFEGLGGASGILPVVREVVADPQHAGVIYAVTAAGLFKSTDGGAAWQRIDQGSPLQPAWDLAIDPRDSDILYAVAGQGIATATTAKSTDGGQTWSPLDGPIGTFQVVEVDPWTPSTVYIAGETFWRSEDEGASWTEVPRAPSGWTRLVAGPAPGLLYGLSFASLFGSGDRGDTWIPVELPVENPFQTTIFDLARGQLPAAPLYVGTNVGVFRLATASSSWARVGGRFSAVSVAADALRVYAGAHDGLVVTTLAAEALRDLRRKHGLRK